MKPTEFVKVNGRFWGEHLGGVSEHLPGSHRTELAGQLLYPRLMVLTETPDWNILELVGVSREYRSLEVRRQKAASVEEYFGLGAGAPVVTLPGENVFKDATVATEVGRRELAARWPGAVKILGDEYVGAGEQLFGFAPGNYSVFDRVLLAHTAGSAVRVRWTFFAVAIHRSEPAGKYLDFLQNYINAAPHLDPVGTVSVPVDPAALRDDAFTSTYLAHGLQDVTVDEFLSNHEGILLSAFDATRLISRPHLERHDGAGEALTPDFLLERADGTHVVGDLALPLLESGANGKKHRRSVTRPVHDGAGRLAEYEEYFKVAENRAFVQTKYGVDVQDPRKLLIVGTQDIVTAEDLTQVAPTGAEILDYDTVLRLHLAAKS
ncbi:hypothetical protein FB561_0656 [Kribbella amoyensis]|uniref:Uncharacterized protein n=1 Tax=Kribbella amoyensis TaxID=996641 RepID=A0A561BL45_9ACTN|nr:hypothetical protein [Kribbella amoyensis]TWD79594.1 hypothetical protein FB561_0656 [Kribbella amoyensis]